MKSSVLVAVLGISLLGCDRSNRPPVYSVRGEVRVAGQPAAGARVFFHPADALDDPRKTRPFATVNADGSFQVTTFLLNDGAPPGDYVVTITWPTGTGSDDVNPGDRLQGRYAKVKDSNLRVTVKSEANTLGPFDLSEKSP